MDPGRGSCSELDCHRKFVRCRFDIDSRSSDRSRRTCVVYVLSSTKYSNFSTGLPTALCEWERVGDGQHYTMSTEFSDGNNIHSPELWTGQLSDLTELLRRVDRPTAPSGPSGAIHVSWSIRSDPVQHHHDSVHCWPSTPDLFISLQERIVGAS